MSSYSRAMLARRTNDRFHSYLHREHIMNRAGFGRGEAVNYAGLYTGGILQFLTKTETATSELHKHAYQIRAIWGRLAL